MPTPSAANNRMSSLSALARELRGLLGTDRVGERIALAPYTTYGVGGPADVLVETRSSDELLEAARCARGFGAPLTVLGGGSNVLVSDAGVRGVVIRARGGRVEQLGPGRVRAEAGVTLNGLVRFCIVFGLAGPEAWAGTPGTVGGALHGNAHYAGRLLSEHVASARLLPPDAEPRDVPAAEMGFGYDRSRLQGSGELLLSAEFAVSPQEPAALREVARASLRHRKATQPLAQPSAGCVFQNPAPDDPSLPQGLPASAGALIDAAGLKGARVGGAQVSTVHANFIVTSPGARARDVAALIERCREAVLDRFSVSLEEEIVRLGELA